MENTTPATDQRGGAAGRDRIRPRLLAGETARLNARIERLDGTLKAQPNALRRVIRRAVWQPRAVLRGLWARLRVAWRGSGPSSELISPGSAVDGGTRAARLALK